MDTDQGIASAEAADRSETGPSESLRLARAAAQQGDFTQALENFKAAAIEDPNDLAVQMELGRALGELERPAEAEAVYQRVLEQDPKHAPAHRRLGQIAHRRRDLAAALSHFEAATAEDPSNLTGQLELARALRELERPAEAEAVYRRVLEQDPEHALAHWRLGQIAHRRRDLAAALSHFEAATAGDPSNLTVLMELGRALGELERPAEAEAAYRRVLEQDPKHALAHWRLGQIASRRRDLAAALSHFEAATAEDPSNLTVQLELARTLRELERPAEAEAIYRRVLEQDPTHARARPALGHVEWDQGRRSQALEHFQAATAGNPVDPKLSLQLGARLLAQWRVDDAEAAFRRVIDGEPGNAVALHGLGRCALIRGERDEALASFRAAAASEPGNQRIRAEIRRLDTDQAAFDWKAELLEAAAVMRAPDSGRDERAWALQLLIGYGVTDLVRDAFPASEKASPVARRFLQAARQLDRMGLSQPAGALERDAEGDSQELNALTGAVERLNPGADTLVLVFSGRLHRTFLSLDIMHRILRTTGASLAYLRDLERTRYLGGVVGLGAGFAGAADAFRAMIERSGARRLLTIGHCSGCAGALRFGLALGAQAVLGVAPRIGAASKEGLSARAAAKLAALREAEPRFGGDLPSLYLAAARPPQVTLIGGADVEPDATFARDMAEKVPGARFVGMPGAYSECLSEILARGLLSPLFSSFVADGAVAPDILEALGRDAPEDAKAGPRPDLSGTQVAAP